MKKILALVLLISTIMIVGCKKSEKNKDGVIVVTVMDRTNRTYEDFEVYAIDESTYNMFGLNSFYKDKMEITDSKGQAEFKFDEKKLGADAEKYFYFFVNYTTGGQSYTAFKGVKVVSGETKNADIIMPN